MAKLIEEKRAAAAAASRRWRAAHPERAKQVERDAYHRRQAKDGKESGPKRASTPAQKRERAINRTARWQQKMLST